MKPPPLLLGAALIFWGWQTDFFWPGVAMAAVLEGALVFKARWEVTDDDFTRIWTFCTVAFLAAMAYAFTANEGPASLGVLFQEPSLAAQNRVGVSSSRTAIAVIRWLPMVFFLFMVAQAYGSREKIPLANISWFMRRRKRRAEKLGLRLPEPRSMNIGYPYFAGCLFAASAHIGGTSYFWGLGVLLMWALWSRRSPRFGIATWVCALCVAGGLGYLGQLGIGQLARLAESLNAQWFSSRSGRGFDPNKALTEIGQIGRIKTSGKIVIRVAPKKGGPPPTYLREASYRDYGNTIWSAGQSGEAFKDIQPEAITTTWILRRRKATTGDAEISCYLENGKGLLPLPTDCARLENLPADLVQTNANGATRATGPGLVVFDALYGPGPTIDSPPGTNDLRVSPNEAMVINQVAEGLQFEGQTEERKLQAVRKFFQDDFTYSLWQNPGRRMKTQETPLARFLLQTHSGHCEYFATATVLLLRQLGIPARYAVGYAVHEGSGGKYVVRQRDAHAWCLVWDEETKMWKDFDTTPASWMAAEGRMASGLQFLSDWWSGIWFQFSKFRWGQTHLRQYILWGLVPVMAVLLYQIIVRRGRRQNLKKTGAGSLNDWPGLDSEFYRLEAQLARRGVIRQTSEPLTLWLQRAIADPALREADAPLHNLLRLHYRHRFDPRGLNQSEREELREIAATCLQITQFKESATSGKPA